MTPKRRVIVISFVLFLLVDAFLLGYFCLQDKSQDSFSLRRLFQSKPGSCLILEEKYCKQVKLVKDPWNENGLLAAFNLPAETKIYSPIDGQFSNAVTASFKHIKTGKTFAYPGVIISNTGKNTLESNKIMFSFVYFQNNEQPVYQAIKKGQIIGTVLSKPIDYFGYYNLIFKVTNREVNNNIVSYKNDVNELKKILKID
jgi:hypothetical protein